MCEFLWGRVEEPKDNGYKEKDGCGEDEGEKTDYGASFGFAGFCGVVDQDKLKK